MNRLILATTAIVLLSSSVFCSAQSPVVAADRIVDCGPYLQNPSNSGISVFWHTSTPSYCTVEYGTDTLSLLTARTLFNGQSVCGTMHKVVLDELSQGVKYYYRIRSEQIVVYEAYHKEFGNTALSTFHTFTLPDDRQTDFTAVVFNDLHRQADTYRRLCSVVDTLGCDMVFYNGDCIDDPAGEQQVVGWLAELCKGMDLSDRPAFFIRGNHEIRNQYSVALADMFRLPGDKIYTSFNWGDTRFVTLDCGEDKPDSTWVYYGLNDFEALRNEQCDFLRSELSSRSFRHSSRRILLHHIPLYGNTDNYQPCSELWIPLLRKARFDVALNGHTHAYARYLRFEKDDNPFPVVVGGDYSVESSTVMILRRRGNALTLTVMNSKGEVVDHIDL